MSNKIPLAYADVELQLSTAVAVASTSFSVSSATDDDGNALPAGKYCFTVDNGTSNKEYLMGQLNGTDVTSVYSVSRQGVESSGAARAHRVGASVILTDFATIQRVADILRGQVDLDSANPVGYDAEPTLADRKDLATVGYVLDTVSGGTVAYDAQTIAGTGGESIVAGNLVYFKTSDQEWYKTDADTTATIDAVQVGIALGTGSDGVAITGGVQISGTYTTTGLTAGALYYASNTAGALSTSAGTNSKLIGLALSTTKLLLLVQPSMGAFAGAGERPSLTNKFITQGDIDDNTIFPPLQIVPFTSSGTWTKDAGLKYVVVEAQGSGGDGATDGGGGGGGGYSRKVISAASLGATETVTVGTAGLGSGNTTFGAHVTAGNGADASGNTGGAGGAASGGDVNISGQAGQTMDDNGTGGAGGNSILGFGAHVTINDSVGAAMNGDAAVGYGGGGAGGSPATDGSPSGGTGGAGTAGIVIVTEYYS